MSMRWIVTALLGAGQLSAGACGDGFDHAPCRLLEVTVHEEAVKSASVHGACDSLEPYLRELTYTIFVGQMTGGRGSICSIEIEYEDGHTHSEDVELGFADDLPLCSYVHIYPKKKE